MIYLDGNSLTLAHLVAIDVRHQHRLRQFCRSEDPAGSLSQLQINLARSHAAGVGDPLPVDVVRAMMALRANVLAKGYSSMRVETLDLLLELLNCQVQDAGVDDAPAVVAGGYRHKTF